MNYDNWFEIIIIEIKAHMPRKNRYALCSNHRNNKTAVHRTINGKGTVARLYGKRR